MNPNTKQQPQKDFPRNKPVERVNLKKDNTVSPRTTQQEIESIKITLYNAIDRLERLKSK